MFLTVSQPVKLNSRSTRRMPIRRQRWLRMIGSLSVVALGLSQNFTRAADWIEVYQDPRGHELIETDVASIDHRGEIALAWERVSFSDDQYDTAGRAYRSRVELWAYQCGAQRSALLQVTEYSDGYGQGEAIAVVDFTPDYHWGFATRDSIGEKTLRFACTPPDITSRQKGERAPGSA
jgi:Surface-adhesin protein E